MLHKVLLSSAALLAVTGIAAAADLPSRMAPPIYAPAPLPIFTWTGAYFGVNAGYAFDHEGRFRTTGLFPTTTSKANSSGFTGGGQIGYNYQLGGFGFGGGGVVVGVEADAAYTDTSKTGIATFGGTTGAYRSGLDYLGTVRGRVGYAFNQFLIYGTGGLAYGGVNNRFSINGLTGQNNSTETGYTYGGGVEYALPTGSFLNFFKSSAVTIKAEYLHYDLGHTTIALANGVTTRASNDGDLARVGLNYKFGSY